jgi:HSP20 family protein
MAEAANKTPVEFKRAERPAPTPAEWHPFDSLRREIDNLFDDFGIGRWRSPLFARSSSEVDPIWRTGVSWPKAPAVDVSETDKAYEVTAELPGMDENNIEVKLADDVLTIKGEKRDEKEEKKKDYYVSERRFGSFQRAFTVPSGVDVSKIEANFKNGVLTVTMPKSVLAQKSEKKIEIKTAT